MCPAWVCCYVYQALGVVLPVRWGSDCLTFKFIYARFLGSQQMSALGRSVGVCSLFFVAGCTACYGLCLGFAPVDYLFEFFYLIWRWVFSDG